MSAEASPPPFIPPVGAIHGVPRRHATHPIPAPHHVPVGHPRPQIVPPTLKPTMPGPIQQSVPIPVHHMMPRGVSSQASQPPAMPPFPRPEHSQHSVPPPHLRLQPRPFGHGRSSGSAPMHPPVPEPVSAPPIPQSVNPQSANPQPVNPVTGKALPKLPASGGLGLFVVPESPVKPTPPPPETKRPAVARRATVSECQRVPTPEREAEDFIKREHDRLDQMWEEEQELRRKEMEAERQRYEDEMSEIAQPLPTTPPRRTSSEGRSFRGSDSPVYNEHGLMTPPTTTMSPSSKAQKATTPTKESREARNSNSKSTKEDRDRWRQDIRHILADVQQQDEQRAVVEKQLRRENSRRERARREAESGGRFPVERIDSRPEPHVPRVERMAPPAPATPAPPPPPPPPAAFIPRGASFVEESFSASVAAQSKAFATRREQEARRQVRPRRRLSHREAGYLTSTDQQSKSMAAPPTWRATRPRRYYGEGQTDLRDEGVPRDPRKDEEDEWQDFENDSVLKEQDQRMAKAAWDLYEQAWAEFFSNPPQDKALRFVEIPWPSLEPLPLPPARRSSKSEGHDLPPSALQISAVLNEKSIGKFLLSPYHSIDKSSKTRLRNALLRFHPDKVSRWINLVQESERNAVVMGVEIVVRCLNSLMKTVRD